MLEGLYYVSPVTAACVLLAALLLDVPRLDTARAAAQLPKTWPVFCLVAVLGFFQANNLTYTETSPSPSLRIFRATDLALTVVCGDLFDPGLSRYALCGAFDAVFPPCFPRKYP